MKIRIQKPFNELRQELSISYNKIRKTIQSPDKVNRINLNKVQKELTGWAEGETITIGFYLKKFFKNDDEIYILVSTREPPKKREIIVTVAYKINKKIIPNIDEIEPIPILQKFIDYFGLPVTIENQTRKFFYRELIPLRTKTPLPRMHVPKGHRGHQYQFMKIDSKTNNVICILVYAIDYTNYIEWLKEVEI